MPKKYIPDEKEKYMCTKQKTYFKKRLMEWRNEIIKFNNSVSDKNAINSHSPNGAK